MKSLRLVSSLVRSGALFLTCAGLLLISSAVQAQTQTAPAAAPAATPVPADVAGTGSASTPTPVPEKTSPKYEFEIGPEVGVFFPSSGHTSNRFGSAWYAIGIGFGTINPASTRGQWGLDLTIVSRYGSNSHIFVAPLGVQYREALSANGVDIPYVGASADIVFADIRSLPDNVHSGFHETGGGSVFVGTTLSKNAYIQAQYLINGSVKGFDLSGLNLTAGARF